MTETEILMVIWSILGGLALLLGYAVYDWRKKWWSTQQGLFEILEEKEGVVRFRTDLGTFQIEKDRQEVLYETPKKQMEKITFREIRRLDYSLEQDWALFREWFSKNHFTFNLALDKAHMLPPILPARHSAPSTPKQRSSCHLSGRI